MIHVISQHQIARALQKWMEDYNASPETFSIYTEYETEKDYGVAGARTLLNYIAEGVTDVAE